MARLQEHYRDNIVPALKDKLGIENVMEVPRITKITLNMGVGEAVADKKVMEHAVRDMTAIAGQKPVVRNARKSVAGFKIREGYPIGCKVTLRRERMDITITTTARNADEGRALLEAFSFPFKR